MVYLLEYIIENFLLPGQVESWNLIINLNNIGLFGLPLGKLQDMINCLYKNYRGRLNKLYLVNSPSSMSYVWGAMKGVIDERTIDKISFSSGSHPENIFSHVNPLQIEQKFGGKSENLTNFWYIPIPIPSTPSPINIGLLLYLLRQYI